MTPIEKLRSLARMIPLDCWSSAITEVADEMDWRPIETAPKDGSFFLITNIEDERAFYEVGKYSPYTVDRYESAGDGLFKQVQVVVMEFTHDNFHRATHWCPVIPAIKNFREE